jgi:hypothetical protein
VAVEVIIKFLVFKILSPIHQMPQTASGRLSNRQDNLPLIEEATEREPCGSRMIRF